MNSIPNIAFQSSNNQTDIEFLNLSELFARILDIPEHNPKKPHRILFNALLFVTAGEGKHQVDLTSYSLKRGDVLKIAKGQVHAFQGDLNYDGVLLIFTEDFVLKHFSKSSLEIISHLYNYHISTPLVENCPFNDAFLEGITIELSNKESKTHKNIVAKLVELYLLQLERFSQNSEWNEQRMNYAYLFENFRAHLELNFSKTRNVKDFAEMMSISPKHLNTIVQSVTHNSAKSFIDQFVVLEIKRSIQSTDQSLKEIAYSLGFDEVTNFTKFFKKRTGLTPKAYKLGV